MIPDSPLVTALSAPVSQEPKNYQRLETLGDTVLKQVMAALLGVSVSPEGYLAKRKDHMKLAKENMTRLDRGLFEIKKWEPLYIATIAPVPTEESSEPVTQMNPDTLQNQQEDSTVALPEVPADDRMLTDVVEWLIGAVYVHDGLSSATNGQNSVIPILNRNR
ncbi:hypothetical protein GYMLUDRAFT_241066 [Collybiopsis luxurians FD-317 M1]|nr:hypothetical protein GYMLUDRAFT_241066 [Collybiopsis luxurians FD-317 M1]